MIEPIALKPCPFCGSPSVEIRGATAIYAVCRLCMSSSGCFDSKVAAAAAWNNRHNEKENTDD